MNEYEGLSLDELYILRKKHQEILKKINYAISRAKKDKLVKK